MQRRFWFPIGLGLRSYIFHRSIWWQIHPPAGAFSHYGHKLLPHTPSLTFSSYIVVIHRCLREQAIKPCALTSCRAIFCFHWGRARTNLEAITVTFNNWFYPGLFTLFTGQYKGRYQWHFHMTKRRVGAFYRARP